MLHEGFRRLRLEHLLISHGLLEIILWLTAFKNTRKIEIFWLDAKTKIRLYFELWSRVKQVYYLVVPRFHDASALMHLSCLGLKANIGYFLMDVFLNHFKSGE